MKSIARRLQTGVQLAADVLSGTAPTVPGMDPFVAYYQTRIVGRPVADAPSTDVGTGERLYVCVSTIHRNAIDCLTPRVGDNKTNTPGENVFDDEFVRERGRLVRFPDEGAFDALQLRSGHLAAFLLVRPTEVAKARHWFAKWPEYKCTSAPDIELCFPRHR